MYVKLWAASWRNIYSPLCNNGMRGGRLSLFTAAWTMMSLRHCLITRHRTCDDTVTPPKLAKNIRERAGDTNRTTSPSYRYTILYTAPDMSRHIAVSGAHSITPSMKPACLSCRHGTGQRGWPTCRYSSELPPACPEHTTMKGPKTMLVLYCW